MSSRNMLLESTPDSDAAPSHNRKETRDDSAEAIKRAFRLLDGFGPEDSQLTLSELSRRAGIPKTTALRIARTLESCRYLVQLKDGAWRLGPSAAWLGARYQVAFDLNNTIESDLTGRETSCRLRFSSDSGGRHVAHLWLRQIPYRANTVDGG